MKETEERSSENALHPRDPGASSERVSMAACFNFKAPMMLIISRCAPSSLGPGRGDPLVAKRRPLINNQTFQDPFPTSGPASPTSVFVIHYKA
jgi:hypothetical protein